MSVEQGAPLTKHMPGLDGLRGVAILLVMAHNFNLLESTASPIGTGVNLALNFGWVGVQLFFVLSGFLITNILLSTRDSKNYFGSFYGRRALRIFPLYYASLAIGLIVVPLLTGETIAGAEHQVWLWTYLSNWAAPSGLAVAAYPHMWSLAVEEQFYLVWPLVVYLLGRAALLRACILLALIALAVRISLRVWDDNMEGAYQYTVCRMDALTIGAAAAIVFRQDRARALIDKYRSALRILVVFATFALFVSTRGAPRTGLMTETYGYTLLALIAALIILDLAHFQPSDRLGRAFSWGPLCRVGAYSYSAYIIHKPMHAFVGLPLIEKLGFAESSQSSPLIALAYFALATVTVLALSALSYNLFERRFLALKRHFVAAKPAHMP